MNFDPSELDACFERKFSFHREDDWDLPSMNLLHEDDIWELESFKEMKLDLNNAKSHLNDKGEAWQEHTALINKAGDVIRTLKRKVLGTELLTQAWCKFYEILGSYKIFPEKDNKYKSLHLCEAPGAFISALNYYLTANHPGFKWEWYANTLNPYYEDQNVKIIVVDDRLLLPTLKHWCFGEDNTGDITNPSYLKDIGSKLCKTDLVTADGSINCIDDPGEQEARVAELQFSEMLIALKSLAPGGTFVIKKFTFFESITICKMYLLNCVFEEVHVFKPFTSKAGNSEVYVICKGYKGTNVNLDKENFAAYLECLNLTYVSKKTKSLFPLSSLPQSFIVQLQSCCKIFLELQKQAIFENLQMYTTGVDNYLCELGQIKKLCAQKYFERYNVELGERRISKLFKSKRKVLPSFHCNDLRQCKTMFFQALGDTYENLKSSKTMSWIELLNDVDRRLKACFTRKRGYNQTENHLFTTNEHHTENHFVMTSEDLTEPGISNRMEASHVSKRILTGKKIQRIQNSKFCNPLLLHLWIRVSYEAQVEFENHASRTCCYWKLYELILALLRSDGFNENNLICVTRLEDKDMGADPLFVKLKTTFQSYECTFTDIENSVADLPQEERIFYIDTTHWVKSLNSELEIRSDLVKSLITVLKILQDTDTLVLCLQSALTRFTVGILFLLHTLFMTLECFHPTDLAPAARGQLWIFLNFGSECRNEVIEHLESIQRFEVPDTFEVLEVVPIQYLCERHFYEYLLRENNKHLLKKLQTLISTEKTLYLKNQKE